jgi:glycosyltransferase involved in cell wall biosynthesis
MSAVSGRMPVVSVIVPTYANRGRRLQAAIASIWAQDGLGDQFDMEVIVVDDASTGPTEEVVRRFPGTRYVRHDTNRGMSAARNTGLAEATGDYVAFLDDDDLWLPHRLSAQVAVLEEAPGLEVAYSQRARIPGYPGDGWANLQPGSDAPSGWVFESEVHAAIACINTILVPREALDEVGGFDETLSVVGEDHEFTTRLALFVPFRFVPGVVSIVLPSMRERSPEQQRRTFMTKRDNLLALIEGMPNEAKLRELVLSATSWHIAYQFYREGGLERARREFLHWIAEFQSLRGDSWAKYRMREMIFALAFASDSPAERASLFKGVKRAAAPKGLRQRLRVRALLADLWTEIALNDASGGRRNDRMAGSAAVRAILQNPVKPLSRPGLLRLATRAINHVGCRPTAARLPLRQPQAAPSESHADNGEDPAGSAEKSHVDPPGLSQA